jgi:hypothetical protein
MRVKLSIRPPFAEVNTKGEAASAGTLARCGDAHW